MASLGNSAEIISQYQAILQKPLALVMKHRKLQTNPMFPALVNPDMPDVNAWIEIIAASRDHR